MTKPKVLYREKVNIYAEYYHRGSDDFLEYSATIQIKDLGKQPIIMKMKFDGLFPSFAPMPPEEHVFRAKDLIDLFLKIKRWFRKYGYEIK
ncbi:MAG: hypothetical protein P8165_14960 [Deltaproteobacteria bacterium]|jgi:hypothetical protein